MILDVRILVLGSVGNVMDSAIPGREVGSVQGITVVEMLGTLDVKSLDMIILEK